jgi:hypothetical protein
LLPTIGCWCALTQGIRTDHGVNETSTDYENAIETGEKTMKTTANIETGNTDIETLDIDIEELEPIMAPKLAVNHNETFVCA